MGSTIGVTSGRQSKTSRGSLGEGTRIPIRHARAVHDVRTTRERRLLPKAITLLELVEAVSETTKDEAELVAVIRQLLCSGAVRLRGNFQDEPVERLVRG